MPTIPRANSTGRHRGGEADVAYFRDQEFFNAEETFLKVSDAINEAIGKLQTANPAPHDRSGDSSYRDANAACPMQLPRISLPKFSGKLTDWVTFKGIFESLIAGNESLSNVQKLHYLKSCVSDEAARLIESLQISDANYEAAWQLLLEEYDNSYAIVNAQIQAFADMPTMRSDNAVELKRVRDTTATSLAALGSMGRSVDSWDDLLVYLVSHKFTAKTRSEWNLKRGDFKECPTYKELTEFMTNRIRGLTEVTKPTESTHASARGDKTRGAVHSVVSAKCIECTGNHVIYNCPAFLKKSVDHRVQSARKHKLCYNCLRPGHYPRNCKSQARCNTCKRPHHTTLHRESPSENDAVSSTSVSAAPSDTINQSTSETKPPIASVQTVQSNPVLPGSVLLATAWVNVSTPEGRVLRTRALLDQGSTFSFVSESLCQSLRVRRHWANLQIRCFGEKYSGIARSRVHLQLSSRFEDEQSFPLIAYTYQRITSYAATRTRPLQNWPHLHDLLLADPDPSSHHPIHLLIGADLYGTLLKNDIRQGPRGTPTAQATAFGWIISGPAGGNDPSNAAANIHTCDMENPLDILLQQFWTDESIPAPFSLLTQEEEECEHHFIATHSRTSSGRYIVRLPFKGSVPPEIGETRTIATRMLTQMHCRLQRNPELAGQYREFLREYESLGHMEMVPPDDPVSRSTVYIPHHPVMRDSSSTTKLRVVFNASCRSSNGTSLNDHLLTGPKLQQDLAAVLLRWRMNSAVCVADIEKMYRQILVHPDDVDYQRIPWFSLQSPSPVSYRLLTVTYGTASAPYLAMRVLKQLIADEGHWFPEIAILCAQSLYVDDILIGADNVSKLRWIRDQLIAFMQCGGFNVRKWNANSNELLQDLSPSSVDANRILFSANGEFKILGISWQPNDDSFRFIVNSKVTTENSKRSILSCIAKLYDPFGWVAPVIISAKILMQELWLAQTNWDDPLPADINKRWETYQENIAKLSDIRIPWWVHRCQENLGVEIHGFADASTRAYAAVVYIRVLQSMTEIFTHLLIAKTKVAPIKTISIPRLKLNALVLLSRLIKWTLTSLNSASTPCYGWTDSTVALAWLSQHPSKWKTYVANRVSEIQETIPTIKWRHVPSARLAVSPQAT